MFPGPLRRSYLLLKTQFAEAEDPVCGSGHCHIIPYWAQQLGKNHLVAYQASQRGGVLYCDCWGKQATLASKAVLYSEGKLNIKE